MPARLIHRRKLVPISKTDGILTVATSDPFDLYAFDELRTMMTAGDRAGAGHRGGDRPASSRHYGVGGDTIDEMIEDDDDLELITDGDLARTATCEMAQEATVIKLVNEILIEALNERASDIHIEPFENDLHDPLPHRRRAARTPPIPPEIRRFQAAIISRIKIMANLNIAEKRLPQDGRIKIKVARPRDRHPRHRSSRCCYGEGDRHASPGQGVHRCSTSRDAGHGGRDAARSSRS